MRQRPPLTECSSVYLSDGALRGRNLEEGSGSPRRKLNVFLNAERPPHEACARLSEKQPAISDSQAETQADPQHSAP